MSRRSGHPRSRITGNKAFFTATWKGPDLTNLYTGAATPFAARLALVLVGLGWVLPFLSPNFREPISSFYGEATAAVIGLAAFACLPSRSLWAGIELPRSSLVFLGFAGLILLHMLLGRSVYLQQNMLAVLYLLWATALAMLAWRLKQMLGSADIAVGYLPVSSATPSPMIWPGSTRPTCSSVAPTGRR